MTDLIYSFIIPAYNESERLTIRCPRCSTTFASGNLQSEIIVVNDGSSDNTAEVLRRFAASNPDIRLLENPAIAARDTACATGCCRPTAT